jgi:hypothetical protein
MFWICPWSRVGNSTSIIASLIFLTFYPEVQAVAPWIELENRIEQLKIRESLEEDQLRSLILSKPSLNPQSRQKVENEIQARIKTLNDIRSELSRMQNILRYRFPERALNGVTSEAARNTSPLDLEAFASKVTLEDRLEKTYQKVLEQYQRVPASVAEEATKPMRQLAPTHQLRQLEQLKTPVIRIGK